MSTNAAETEMLAYLQEVRGKEIGFMDLRLHEHDVCVAMELDARFENLYEPKCVFDGCTDEQAKLFLDAFLDSSISMDWATSVQLCKLLSKRGRLVRNKIETILKTHQFVSCSQHVLFLSYLALAEDGATQALRFLDVAPEDGRDGLFLACYLLNTPELDRKLQEKFLQWEAEGWSPTCTGELQWLQQFICRWLGTYSFASLEEVIRVYFGHLRPRNEK